MKRVGRRRLPRLAGLVELRRVLVEGLARGQEQVRIREDLAELGRAVAVEVGGRARVAEVLGQRAPERALGEVEEVPRLPHHGAVRELQVERDGALGILCSARAGVEDDVVFGERRCPGHDPLDALVVRIALDPGRLHLLEQRADLVRLRGPERREVAVLLSRQMGVVRGELVELVREAGELLRVVAEEGLYGGQVRVDGLLRGGRRAGRLASRLVGVVAPAAGRGDDQAGGDREQGGAPSCQEQSCTGASLHKSEPTL